MSNAVADNYRKYGGLVQFKYTDQKVAAQRALTQEGVRLQSEINKYKESYNGYVNNVLPYLSSAISDYDGYTYNKIKNALRYFEENYQNSDTADKMKTTLIGYEKSTKSIKEAIQRLKQNVENRKKELENLMKDLQNQLSDVKAVYESVKNTAVTMPEGYDTMPE